MNKSSPITTTPVQPVRRAAMRIAAVAALALTLPASAHARAEDASPDLREPQVRSFTILVADDGARGKVIPRRQHLPDIDGRTGVCSRPVRIISSPKHLPWPCAGRERGDRGSWKHGTREAHRLERLERLERELPPPPPSVE